MLLEMLANSKQIHRCILIGLLGACLTIIGCTKGDTNSRTGLTRSTGSPSSLTQTSGSMASSDNTFLNHQIQQFNTPLNDSPKYALTTEDLNVLQTHGLLSDSDPPALAPLVKK